MFHVPEKYRFFQEGHYFSSTKEDGNNGVFYIDLLNKKYPLHCQASDGMGWEHVSVSLEHRCPNWKEMCVIKNLFWDLTDCVMQYHPAEKDYVNIHSNCLHLWRPIDQEIIMPPTIMV